MKRVPTAPVAPNTPKKDRIRSKVLKQWSDFNESQAECPALCILPRASYIERHSLGGREIGRRARGETLPHRLLEELSLFDIESLKSIVGIV